MSDPFVRTLDADAVDLAWVRYHSHKLARYDAVLEMVHDGGVTFDMARLLLESNRLPSNSGLLAVTG